MSKITKAQIEEWKKKHGTVYELESNGKVAYIFDPTSDLRIMKLLLASFKKGSFDLIDALIANCWLGGDEEIKQDKYKQNLVDQAERLIDIPDYEVVFHDGIATIRVNDKSVIDVRLATRGDVKYSEDRNKASKQLDTQIYLLERLAIDKKILDEVRKDNLVYLACLLAVTEIKEQEYVAIKKL